MSDGDADGFPLQRLPSECHAGARRVAFVEACRRVILVGEDNPLSSDPRYALYHEPAGCAGSRLQRLVLAVPPRTYLSMWRTNLCVGGWDRESALVRAAQLVDSSVPWDVMVVLGVKVSAALQVAVRSPIRTFEATQVDGDLLRSRRLTIVSIPHPSGRNYAWNDPHAMPRCRELLSRVVPEVAWGELSEDHSPSGQIRS